jgi:hypothetical protein
MGHTPTSLAAGCAITARPGRGGPSRQAARPVIPLTARPDNGGAGQMRRHRQVPSGAARRRARPPREETFNEVSAGRAGSVTRHPQARPRPAVMCGRRPPRTYRWHDHSHAAGRLGRSLVSAAGWPARHILPADYALRVEGEFAAAGRRGTAGPGASPALVFSCPGRVACGAPAGADSCPRQGETLSLAVSCCWRPSQRAGRGSRAPGQRASPAWEPGPAVAGLSGSRTARTVPARPVPASAPFRLAEPQQAQARGYRRQSLPSSSACLINGRVVTCSCRSRSAVLI